MKNTNLTAVLYLRSATIDRGNGLDRQLERCRQIARAIGAEIAGVYTDEACSGNRRERPGLDLLMQHVERERIDVIIAAAPHRLARDTKLYAELCWDIEMQGATVLTEEPGMQQVA